MNAAALNHTTPGAKDGAPLEVSEFERTDYDDGREWGIASITCACGRLIVAHCIVDHGRWGIDVEVEASTPCVGCGLDLDNTELGAVVLAHFEAEREAMQPDGDETYAYNRGLPR